MVSCRLVFLNKAHHHLTLHLICRSKTLGAWGGGLGVVFLYLTDWKVIMGKIPFVKGRFKEIEE